MRKRSHLVIHLENYAHNLSEIKKIAPSNEIIHMIKANAYGHGLVKMVEHTVHELEGKEFGCASMGEALYLRENLPGLEFEILVFSDFDLNNDKEEFLNNRIIPIISNKDDLKLFLETSEFKNMPLYLKFNTGMNRLGIRMDEIEEAIGLMKKAGRKTIDHLMTHFACASLSMQKNSHNLRQKQKFEELKNELSSAGLSIEQTSIANSGAIIQHTGLEETHIRPGLMLYGPGGLAPHVAELNPWHGKIISEMQTYVLDEFMATKGTPIGYGANPCPYEGQVAILGLGYGDGIGTCFSGLHINLNGANCRIIGRVNMDMLAIQVVDQPHQKIFQKGHQVSLWDANPESVSRFCQHAKMIPYEIFCDISSRVPRIYR